MTASQNIDPAALAQEFSRFNRASGTMVSAYQAMERRLARLQQELDESRRERLAQSSEKERLAGRLSLLLDSLPAGVVVLDGRGVVCECNPAAVELLGENLQGLLWREVVERAFAPRPDDGPDVSLVSGRRVNIDTCSLGREPGQVLLIKDVSESRRLHEQIAQLGRLSALGEMAAQLAHQVRTPLASAMLYASGMGRAQLPDAQRQAYAGKLSAVLADLEALVGDMLAFAHRGRYQVAPLATDELLHDLRRAHESGARHRGARLSWDNGAQGALVQGNRAALTGALQNLIDNAAQMGGEGVHVQVSCSRVESGSVRIEVRDDGPGMTPETARQAFEPFFTSRGGGTGLGLAVVRAVAESHGGSIRLHSAPGAGASFTLDLPEWLPGAHAHEPLRRRESDQAR